MNYSKKQLDCFDKIKKKYKLTDDQFNYFMSLQTSLSDVPEDVIFHEIFKFLDSPSKRAFAKTSKMHKKLNDKFWKKKFDDLSEKYDISKYKKYMKDDSYEIKFKKSQLFIDFYSKKWINILPYDFEKIKKYKSIFPYIKGIDEVYLDSFEKSIFNMKGLKRLYFSVDIKLPPEIANLKNLEKLHFSTNSTIPPQIGELSKLKVLRIDGNVKNIPPQIEKLTKLENLIFKLGENVNKYSLKNIAKLKNLKLLRLGGMEYIGRFIRFDSNKKNLIPKELYPLSTYLDGVVMELKRRNRSLYIVNTIF